jgi:hypothetical protein
MPALRLTLKTLCRPGEQPATTLPISPERTLLFRRQGRLHFSFLYFPVRPVPTAVAIPVSIFAMSIDFESPKGVHHLTPRSVTSPESIA